MNLLCLVKLHALQLIGFVYGSCYAVYIHGRVIERVSLYCVYTEFRKGGLINW